MMAARRKLPDFYWALEKLNSDDLFIKFLVLRSLWFLRKRLDLLDILDSLDLLDIQDLSSLRDFLDIHGLREIHYLQDIRALCEQYKCKYEAILKKHKKEIEEWAIRAAAKLHSLSGEELLHYFPGTTPEEMKVF